MEFQTYLRNFARQNPWIKRSVRVCVWPLDVLATLLFLPGIIGLDFVLRDNNSESDDRELLFITFGGGLETTKTKTGNLNHLKNWDGPIETFDHVVWLMYRARRTGFRSLGDSTSAFEQKRIFGIFHYLGWLVMVWRGLSLTRNRPVRLVRTKDPLLCGLCGWVIARLSDLPLAITIQTDYERRLPLASKFYWRILGSLTITKYVIEFLFQRADRILPMRPSMISWITRHGGDEERIDVFRQGVEYEKIHSQDLEPWPASWPAVQDDLLISWAGRLSEDNFADDLITISMDTVTSFPETRVLIAGDGPKKQNMQRLVEQEDLQDQIIFLGWIRRERAFRLRRESEVALELNGGWSLLEACSAGCAPIAYDVEWHHQVVKNDETGWLIPEGRTEKATDALHEAVRNPEKTSKMGQKAQELVRERYSMETTAQRKDAIFQDILEEYDA